MKITGPSGPTQNQPAKRSTAAGGFTLPSEGAARSAASGAVGAVPSTAALLVLQAEALDPDQRRRQVQRGRRQLDDLDRLKLGLMDGRADAATVAALKAGLAAERQPTGDTHLDEVLREIDVRAAVELAKLAMATERPIS
jgi:hypothetical protein